MAQLILTDEERAALLWTDLDDAALGALLRKKLAFLQTAAEQMDRTVTMAAALLLCCAAAEQGVSAMHTDLEGVTQDGREFGDWRVSVARRAAPGRIMSDAEADAARVALKSRAPLAAK